jgi:4-diphosphocytidyl-2-C-methyl-D-erythritol kinase
LSDAALPERVDLTARAKLNLYLHVLGRRADGYHELDSLVAFAAIGDRLSFAPADRLTLEIEGPFADALEATGDNLVLKAGRLLRQRFGLRQGAEIRLEKRLPVAAGLGGGSADAAAALRGLARLWRVQAPDALMGLAAELGADVPACLAGEPSFTGGVGERLAPVPGFPELGVILANPRIPLPTAAVFGARTGPFAKPARWSQALRNGEELIALLQERRNDLTRPALALVPEIGAVLAALGELPQVRLARMSGSGATCFGLTLTASEAERGAQALRARAPGWWVMPSRLLAAGALPGPDELG